jgi:PAS domain S-box-containing protein
MGPAFPTAALERAMVLHTRDSMLVVRDADGVIALANPAAERMFGYSPGELEGRHISAVNAPTDVTPAERAAQILGALDRDGSWQGEVHNVRKDGVTFWSRAEVVAFDLPAVGRVWLATHTDVSRQHESDAALRAAEERYRRVFEEAPSGMALTDREMRITDVNAAFCAITGQAGADLQGASITGLIASREAAQNADLWQRVARGEIPRYRLETQTNGGTSIALSACVARDSRGVAQYGIAVIDALDGR